jgi:hypothetical protein
MKRSRLLFGLFALAALAFGGPSASAAPPGPTTCSGTTLAPGVYNGLNVAGYCKVDGQVVIDGNVKVAEAAYLDATWPGTRLVIDGNVSVGKGAKLGLGCSFGYHGCGFTPTWLGAVIVNGNIDAKDALTMYLDFTIVQGNVKWNGGGNAAMIDSPGNEDGLVLVIKDNVIGGNLDIDGWAGAWFGVIRNNVLGNVEVEHTLGARLDPGTGTPDSTEVAANIITGNLKCEHNSPPAQIGDSGGTANLVLGKKSGECAGL